jgi:hypothetical protein
VEVYVAEAHPHLEPITNDTNSWEHAPKTLHDILKLPEEVVQQEWLKSVKKEFKTLVTPKTFVLGKLQKGEVSTLVEEIFKVKIKSDGSLDKLKMHMVVQGDLQDKNITEDKWSPTASFCS